MHTKLHRAIVLSRASRMRGLVRFTRPATLVAVVVVLLAPSLVAQDTERTFCDDADPETGCPGEDCICTDHSLAIRFENGGSVFRYDTFAPDLEVRSQVHLETTNDLVRGFSLGVRHDPSAVSLVPGPAGLNIEGTISEASFRGGFTALRRVDEGYILTTIFSDAPPIALTRIEPPLLTKIEPSVGSSVR